MALAVEEPNKNWYDEQFRWSALDKDPWFEHWEGPSPKWIESEANLFKGILVFGYCSGPNGAPHCRG